MEINSKFKGKRGSIRKNTTLEKKMEKKPFFIRKRKGHFWNNIPTKNCIPINQILHQWSLFGKGRKKEGTILIKVKYKTKIINHKDIP